MSKDITIQINGTDTDFDSVETVLTQAYSYLSGFPFVPEDETGLQEKTITANGHYIASDENLYGYGRVIVAIPGGEKESITGTFEDGNEYHVTKDENNYIQKELLPSALVIETPPIKNYYNVGNDIMLYGIVAKLKKKDGEYYTDETYTDSIVPVEELYVTEKAMRSGPIKVFWRRQDGQALYDTFDIRIIV